MQREDVWPTEDLSNFRDQPSILQSVQENLFKILDTCQDDVQDFLKNHKDSAYLKKARKIKFSNIEK